MPTYNFKNMLNNEIVTMFITVDERQQFLTDNPNMKQELCAPPTGDSVRLGIRKIDRGFNDVLIKAKKAHWGSNIENHY